MIENIDLVCAFFNGNIYDDVKRNLDTISHYFTMNPGAGGHNDLVGEFLAAIRAYPYEYVDVPLFESILAKSGKNGSETKKILKKILEYRQYTKEQMIPFRNSLKDLCAKELIQRAGIMFKDKPTEYLKFIRQADLRMDGWDSTSIVPMNVNKIDIKDVVKGLNERGYKGAFPWFNNTYPTGLIPPEIILVLASGGSGKSLFAVHSAIAHAINGEKVHLLCLGDLDLKDQVVRMCASFYGAPFKKVYSQIEDLWDQFTEAVGDKLAITISPAGVVDSDEYVNFILDSDYDVCLVDYDANFSKKALRNGDENLFSYFEDLYEGLTKISASGRLCYVFSQVKSNFLAETLLDEASISGSRRKYEIVDACISINRTKGCPNNIGRFNLFKNRRGETNKVVYFIRLSSGKFVELPKHVYDQILQLPEYKDFSEIDIEQMVRSQSAVQAEINNRVEEYKKVMKPVGNGR